MDSLSNQCTPDPFQSDARSKQGGHVPNIEFNPAVNGEKTKEDLEAGGDASEYVEPSPVADSDDYPKGATLAFIVVALAMSMFLVALDMVSEAIQTKQTQQLNELHLCLPFFFCTLLIRTTSCN